MGKALYEAAIVNDGRFTICSMYDRQSDADDNLYFPSENFRGFGINKFLFTEQMIALGTRNDMVILSHINLLPVGWLIKKISPGTKIILLAHGIEIWQPLNFQKTNMLRSCDRVLSVSKFTRNKIIHIHGVPEYKCRVLNNCLDPFLPLPSLHKKNEQLLHKYGFNKEDKILMTLTRLSSKERYKGYDKVIEAIAALQAKKLPVKYLLAGSYDNDEKIFLEKLIAKTRLEERVLLAGYIDDEELENYFAIADIYIMPSRKEGFGIVFIEAMYYGLPVIAGNIDGSADALLNGKLGQLVDPDNVEEITNAIEKVLTDKNAFIPNAELLIKHFSYEAYKYNLQELLKFEKEQNTKTQSVIS